MKLNRPHLFYRNFRNVGKSKICSRFYQSLFDTCMRSTDGYTSFSMILRVKDNSKKIHIPSSYQKYSQPTNKYVADELNNNSQPTCRSQKISIFLYKIYA